MSEEAIALLCNDIGIEMWQTVEGADRWEARSPAERSDVLQVVSGLCNRLGPFSGFSCTQDQASLALTETWRVILRMIHAQDTEFDLPFIRWAFGNDLSRC